MDLQNGKGDFFNDLLAPLLENCARSNSYSRVGVPGLMFPKHNLDVTFPSTGGIEFILEAKTWPVVVDQTLACGGVLYFRASPHEIPFVNLRTAVLVPGVMVILLTGCGDGAMTPEPPRPTALVFATEPGRTEGTVAVNPAAPVIIADQFGNTVDSATTPVTLALGENTAGGTLAGTAVVAAVAGVAAFGEISVDRPGTYTLVATAPGLTGATSGQFRIALTVTAVSAGGNHTCAITTAAATYCWGNNSRGQLGNGSTTRAAVPALVVSPPGVRFAEVRPGFAHTCALSTDGSAYCWGQGGLMGDLTSSDRTPPPVSPVPAGLALLVLSANTTHTCGVVSGGLAYCWGQNGYLGKLGNGSTEGSMTPVLVAVPSDVSLQHVSAGYEHSCAVSDSRTVYCWGWGTGPTPAPVTLPEGVTLVSVAAGMAHTCGLTQSGAAYCWGDNLLGQAPGLVTAPAGGAFVEVSAGWEHNCARTTAGTVYCWGKNASGQLGDGTTGTGSPTPVLVAAPAGVRFAAVSAGSNYSCALTPEGAVYCWGSNDAGKLGNGASTGFSPVPVQIVQ